jgi:hypothetical protein
LLVVCFVNIIYMFVSAAEVIFVCYPVVSHPCGTLASRSRAAQTARGIIRVRAPSTTSSAGPRLDGGATLWVQHLFVL